MSNQPHFSYDAAMEEVERLTGGKTPVILRPAGSGVRVRNVETGRVLPCCLGECRKPGSVNMSAAVPHEQPRWVDEKNGTQEMRVYIFCSEAHRREWCDTSSEYQQYQQFLATREVRR